MKLLNYVVSGNAERPAVFLLHGFMGSSADWAPVVEALAPRLQCVAVDLPGHGASTGLEDGAHTMAGAAAGLARVLDDLGCARAHVAGYSMGGRLALYFALHHPERCRRLVLESASPGLRTEAERAARRHTDAERAARIQADLGAFLDDWYRMPLFASLAQHGDLLQRRIAARRQNDPGELVRSLAGMGTGQQPSLWPQLPHLQSETLALAGALDANYVRLAREMASAAPRLRAGIVPEAGHTVHAERPETFAQRLASFFGAA